MDLLLRLLDDDIDAAERETLRAHVDGCPTCADRLRALRERSAGVSAWLARHDPPAPERSEYDLRVSTRTSPRRAWWAIAATVVLAVAVAAGPARAWLMARLGIGEPPAAQSSGDPAPSAMTATAFIPQGGVLAIAFDAGVRGRTLSVIQSTDSLATLDENPSRAEVVVGPDRLDVHDADQPPGAYRLTVPVSVTTVLVRVAGAREIVVHPEARTRVVDIPSGGA